MQYPPIKAIEAVKQNRVDYRTKRLVTHFRPFFRCLDKEGKATENEDEIVRIELTQRANQYYDDYKAKRNQPAPQPSRTLFSNTPTAG